MIFHWQIMPMPHKTRGKSIPEFARGLRDLETTMSDVWKGKSDYLRKHAPSFLEKFSAYVDRYRSYEELSDKIVKEVRGSKEIQEYLTQYHTREKLRDFLSDGDKVDSYQFVRSTVFWAKHRQPLRRPRPCRPHRHLARRPSPDPLRRPARHTW